MLELYGFEGCPSCKKVRATLSSLGITYIHRSAPFGADATRAELRARGGKVQVPYLIDPNRVVEMYESESIIQYLDETYGIGVK